jgi:hypothetical protein
MQMEKPDAPGRLPGPGIEFTQTTDALGMLSEGPANQGPAPLSEVDIGGARSSPD